MTDYEEIDMDEGETSIQNGGSRKRFETAAILQQRQFSKQQNKTLETEIHSLKVQCYRNSR